MTRRGSVSSCLPVARRERHVLSRAVQMGGFRIMANAGSGIMTTRRAPGWLVTVAVAAVLLVLWVVAGSAVAAGGAGDTCWGTAWRSSCCTRRRRWPVRRRRSCWQRRDVWSPAGWAAPAGCSASAWVGTVGRTRSAPGRDRADERPAGSRAAVTGAVVDGTGSCRDPRVATQRQCPDPLAAVHEAFRRHDTRRARHRVEP